MSRAADSDAVLVLLPGLGADPRLFEPQRAAFPRLIAPDWLLPRDSDTLRTYAERMADVVRAAVPEGRPLVLGGVSFGGMIASEMAAHLHPKRLVLIGSALSPGEIAPALKGVAAAGRFLPTSLGERSKKMGKLFIRQLGPMRRQDREFLETMIDAVPFSLIKWAGRAIFSWPGAAPTCPIIRIHGDRDRIIPLREQDVRHVIRGGGHVPSVSHADEVNAFLASALQTP